MSEITLELAKEHGLSEDEFENIIELLGRKPNITELGIFSAMFSEHCSYKTTKIHLKKLPTDAPWVICGPGENAGVIDIGDGQAAIFKMESHNHPSFIEPFQGAATGVGGIMRDVFTMGARPVALLNSLRFGDITHEKTRHLVDGVVGGISFYGNCIGVPTVGGECTFHKSYNGNILVNAMCVGVADTDKIFYSKAAGVGNPVVYVGAKTGRDGIHGASMASQEFEEEMDEEKRPTVQVGDPFTEKLLLEACLELMQEDAIIAIQDMGAAGLTSSSLEMAGKGGLGMEIDLDKVPMRESGMNAYELMLSESQERMLIILQPGKEELAKKIFDKWELDFAVIGKLTDTGNLVLNMHGECQANLPIAPVSSASPEYDRPHEQQKSQEPVSEIDEKVSMRDALKNLMSTPDMMSKRWIYDQYDNLVMNDTLASSGTNAAVVRVHGTQKALVISSDCTPRYCAANAHLGAAHAVAETYRNIASTGAKPLAITNCLNFGNPEKPEIMGQIVGAIHGIKEACEALSYPVISGNVSLYNETAGASVQPTPTIGGVGLLENAENFFTSKLQGEGSHLYVIGETKPEFGSSLYLREIEGKEEGAPPALDFDLEIKHAQFIRALIAQKLISSCSDVSDGGLLCALADSSIASQVGMQIEEMDSAIAFSESASRYIIETDSAEQLEKLAAEKDIFIEKIATVSGDVFAVKNNFEISLEELSDENQTRLEKFMAA